ncbi:MAG TPA: GTP cyclohydrolase I FolE [Candidatus Absconditabacterales bacterium]|nr:GTP cyclohydrolase I FolE [Candidatus Absconditabacterales bacterium]HOQ78767.1 GTP cyclohydrolase I FolE [Candidatus Absconditabacterales bacterium]HPK27886.1 GTP cyclohydrolase I FolE [Candidatus Absconditabacterales bacterium]
MIVYPSKSNGLTNNEKISIIEKHFFVIMETLGLDLDNDSLKKTPYRVGKMLVEELFFGLDKNNEPSISTFDNKFNYDEIIIVKNIKVFSFCEHHFLPFVGNAYVGYIPNGKVIGLSKINRIVNYLSRKPQIQERLNEEISEYMKKILGTDNVIVIIKAIHYCMIMRGIKDINSSTVTSKADGCFRKSNKTRTEFMKLLNL